MLLVIVSNNPLKDIRCIVACKQLQFLCLDDTGIASIPEELFSSLTKLRVLSARWNKLEALPDTLGCLSSIEQLSFGENKLRSIPESVAKLAPTLKVLSCLLQCSVIMCSRYLHVSFSFDKQYVIMN